MLCFVCRCFRHSIASTCRPCDIVLLKAQRFRRNTYPQTKLKSDYCDVLNTDRMPDPKLPYAQRATNRLSKLLDEEGYPLDLLGRINSLADSLKIAHSVASQLLSGLVEWDWQQLHKVCNFFGKDPGYFLDKHYSAEFPSDTKVVLSANGRDTLAMRFPSDFLQIEADGALQYLTIWEDGASGAAAGDRQRLDVFSTDSREPLPGERYVIDNDGRLVVLECVEVRGRRAVFTGEDMQVEALLPIKGRRDESRTRIVGPVVASIAPTYPGEGGFSASEHRLRLAFKRA